MKYVEVVENVKVYYSLIHLEKKQIKKSITEDIKSKSIIRTKTMAAKCNSQRKRNEKRSDSQRNGEAIE